MAESTAKSDAQPSDAMGINTDRAHRHPRCPECAKPAARYEGDNEHKQGTGVCPDHGRVRLED